MEMKVTADRLVPIIPKATKYQGASRFPVKKVCEVARRDVTTDTTISITKYIPSMVRTSHGDISIRLGVHKKSRKSAEFQIPARPWQGRRNSLPLQGDVRSEERRVGKE